MSEKMTYAGVGVNYDAMDPFKRKAQMAGRKTAGNIICHCLGEFKEVEWSRGESAYLIETDKNYIAHVEEGLGTKNLVADAMYQLTGKSYYNQVAQCTVAMIVNDMITLGAMPLSVAMHLAVGDSDWFNDERRSEDLIHGWKKACDMALCVWGGGETPTLKKMIAPATAVLAGSAMGIIQPKEGIIIPKIRHEDVIMIAESSGIHANGLTLARKIGERKDSFLKKIGNLFYPDKFSLSELPDGYLTKLSDGRTYGETLLDPTHIYVRLIKECLISEIDIHYVVNITGHGWRKLMRDTQSFTYMIESLPRQLPIFDFIQKHGPVDDQEAYGNFNMGAGFALYVPEKDVDKVLEVSKNLGYRVFCAGHIEKSEEKKVVIKPRGLEYHGSTLKVR